VLVISRKSLLPLAVAAAIAFVGTRQPVFAQAAQPSSTQAPQKNWKDRAEYDLYDSITKETQAAKRLELLNTWRDKYPSSEFADVRQQLYMQTYQELGRWPDVFATAKDILNKDPNNVTALSKLLTALFALQSPTPDDLATADKAANQVLSNLDALFAPEKKPANVSEADWAASKKPMQMLAQNALGYTALQRKDYAKAETEFTKSLQLDANAPQVSYWLGIALLGEKKYPQGLYEYARAAAYDGPNALAPAGRQQIRSQLENYYTQYHGSKDGLDQLLAQAKSSALPPPDFKLLSKADLAEQKLKQEEEFKKQNPELALWLSIKEQLTGPNAQTYFDSSMKGAELPEFKGKLIESRPAVRPKELVLAIENGTTPDATLKLDAALPGKMDPGAEISFKGIATSYTSNPFMVTFEVPKDNVKGWKGAPAPATKKSGARRPVRKKQ
jgi:hypothetical protein